MRNDIVAFGGRVMDNALPKYINSPESEIYHKSDILYGIYFAKNAIIKNDKCYMVEGYTDVLSLHEAGVENVVASSGTSLTINQVRLVNRFTNNLTIVYDGDAAGIKASLRGIDIVLEAGMNVKVVPLPNGEDPDSYSKSLSALDFQNFLKENEQDFIRFKTQLLLKEVENDPVKRAGLITDIVSSIALIPSSITRSEYIKECSRLLQVKEDILHSEALKVRFKKDEKNYKNVQYQQQTEQQTETKPLQIDKKIKLPTEVFEKELTRLLLNYGAVLVETNDNNNTQIPVAEFIIHELLNDELEFEETSCKKILDEYTVYLTETEGLFTGIDYNHFINHVDEQVCALTTDLLSSPYELSNIWKKHDNHVLTEDMVLKQVVTDTLNAYKLEHIKRLLAETDEGIRKAQEQNLTEQIETLMHRMIALNDFKIQISKQLGERTFIK